MCLYRIEKKENENISHVGLMSLKGLLSFTLNPPPLMFEHIDQTCPPGQRSAAQLVM